MATNAPRVFLHVGSPKTGTTFLQSVLWRQRDLCTDQGLLVPGRRFHDHYLATLDVRGLAEGADQHQDAVGMWRRIVGMVEAHPGTSLISHELFSGATPPQAAAAMAAFSPDTEVHLVLTVRDLVRQVPAEWQEHVKHRHAGTLPEFVESLRRDKRHRSWFWRVQDFADVAERWGSTLPPSRVHVVSVPPQGADPRELWTRFASMLGLEPDAFSLDVPRSNTSLGLEQTELLRRVNGTLGDRLPIPGPYPRVVKNIFAQQVLASRPGAPLRLDADDARFAAEASSAIADRLGQAGYRVHGSLDDLVVDAAAAESAAWPAGYAEATDAQLVDEATVALSALLERLARQQQALRRHEDRWSQLRHHPVRFALVRASERSALLGRARVAYRAARDRREGRGRPGGTSGEPAS
jgi:hypothetical protein